MYLNRGKRATRLASILGLLIGFMLTQGGPALAASSSDPIRIDDCHIMNSRFYALSHRSLALTFTNRRLVPANEVHFTVEYAGRVAHITDTGTFSTNIGIHHAFDAFPSSLYYSYGSWPENCTVDYVHYSDSSLWAAREHSTHPQTAGSNWSLILGETRRSLY